MYEDLELLEMDDLEDFEGLEFEDDEFEDWEFDGEAFEDWEAEDLEADYFLGGALKKLARTAAKTVGKAVAGPTGANIASLIARNVLQEAEFDDEEDEFETEEEYYAEGGDPEILEEMHHCAAMAAKAPSKAEADEWIGALARLAGPLISSLMREEYEDYEDMEDFEYMEDLDGYEDFEYDEADEFFPALIPLATSLLPKAAPLISKGIGALGRLFSRRRRRRRGRRRRVHREAVRTLPDIAAEAAVTLKRQAKAGRKVTRKKVAAAMAKATAKKLASPRKLAKAVKKNKMAASRARRKSRVLPARGRKVPARTARRLRV